jgi:hypothetical protein
MHQHIKPMACASSSKVGSNEQSLAQTDRGNKCRCELLFSAFNGILRVTVKTVLPQSINADKVQIIRSW